MAESIGEYAFLFLRPSRKLSLNTHSSILMRYLDAFVVYCLIGDKMKKLLVLSMLLLLAGCKGEPAIEGFTEDQMAELGKHEEVLNKVRDQCEYQESVRLMMDAGAFNADDVELYCQIPLRAELVPSLTTLVTAGYDADQIKTLFDLNFYRPENTARYLNYAADNPQYSLEDVVVRINIGLDVPFFTNTHVIEDTSDFGMLINKYNELPEGYEPAELMITPSPCTIGFHFSCSFNDPQYVEKTAGEHFQQLVDAAAEAGIKINAIASYRSYDYQYNLYHYYLNEQGQEYADLYYARPGQSEHNSGLASEVTMNDMNYNEIELGADYPWLLEHMADYGFILRYPEDKTEYTGFGYESWHLRYVGEEIAKVVMENNWCLEEYYARMDVTK